MAHAVRPGIPCTMQSWLQCMVQRSGTSDFGRLPDMQAAVQQQLYHHRSVLRQLQEFLPWLLEAYTSSALSQSCSALTAQQLLLLLSRETRAI